MDRVSEEDTMEAATAKPERIPMLSLRKVAEWLGVSVKTVRRLRTDGAFPGAQKVRGQLRIPERDVADYLRSGRAA